MNFSYLPSILFRCSLVIHNIPFFININAMIQARAFGRRLPWTALVPFADCLNHANVQTKYDYDVDNNGFFRLFPTGQNSYPKGSEVYNSYGRRANDNLLLDYGFAMMNNQWDQVMHIVSPISYNTYSNSYMLLNTYYFSVYRLI